mmetsp:Transcript_66140/g.193577  ORF Transcript_66140/g.193577 Transcript_66140/m.193577 type:complete len:266 (-) Transcript_66140:668-1465(-)
MGVMKQLLGGRAHGSSVDGTLSACWALRKARAPSGGPAAAPCSSSRASAAPSPCARSCGRATRPCSGRWSSPGSCACGATPGTPRAPGGCSTTPRRRRAPASRCSCRRASWSTTSPPAKSSAGRSASGPPTPSRCRRRPSQWACRRRSSSRRQLRAVPRPSRSKCGATSRQGRPRLLKPLGRRAAAAAGAVQRATAEVAMARAAAGAMIGAGRTSSLQVPICLGSECLRHPSSARSWSGRASTAGSSPPSPFSTQRPACEMGESL